MDKNAIKKYATWARRELISRVSQKAEFYGVTAMGYGDAGADSIDGRVLSPTEKTQRQSLINKVRSEGYEQAMEEVAYTWFNRFSALRYMEVNNYLPARVRVFANENGEFKPQILDEAIHLELDGLDMEKVYSLKEANDTEALYRYLLITQCNALSEIMPVMFQKIADYTELLLPDYLLREGSVIEQMITSIPEEDWTDQVQIIGWLYQYYNAEKKDEVFAALKKNVKITKENIPAATQLFTPDWIVRYMVENSLGRIFVQWSVGSGKLSEKERIQKEQEIADKFGWKYYLPEAEQTPEVRAQLTTNHSSLATNFQPEKLKVIDPCAGSGHILDYLFDILMQIYTDYGYTTSEAVRSIVENNLYGLDIDERAAQLAYFSVMMKARSYDRRFLTRKDDDGNPDIPQPHVYAIAESNGFSDQWLVGSGQEKVASGQWVVIRNQIQELLNAMKDAKEYGSILNVPELDFAALRSVVAGRQWLADSERQLTLETATMEAQREQVLALIDVAEALAQKYHVVVTNPPYMGSSGMGAKLSEYVKKHYPNSKSDMSTVFMEKTMQMCADNGYMAMINIPVWMFLSSYEKLREKLLQNNTLVNMVHPGRGIFGSDFGTTTFVFETGLIDGYQGNYRRLFDQQGEVKSPEEREQAMLAGKAPYTAQQSNFAKIPRSPVAYWASEAIFSAFANGVPLAKIAPTRKGMFTGNNELWLKYWHEIDYSYFKTTYKPYNKGGEFRRWYGNNDYVINWKNDGADIIGYNGAGNINTSLYFRKCITWSLVTSYKSSFRAIIDTDHVMGDAGPIAITDEKNLCFLLALLNSKPVEVILSYIAPTINFSNGVAGGIPVIEDPLYKTQIETLSLANVSISRNDWDSFETSWDFKRHPLI